MNKITDVLAGLPDSSNVYILDDDKPKTIIFKFPEQMSDEQEAQVHNSFDTLRECIDSKHTLIAVLGCDDIYVI